MQLMEQRAPGVLCEFRKGNFTVKRTSKKFLAVSPDMALEQTINRDVKCQGGLIGKSSSEGAREKWFMTSHIKASVSATLHDMISLSGSTYGNNDLHHTDNAYDQQKSIEWPAKLTQYFHQQQWNPFIVGGTEGQLLRTFAVSSLERVFPVTENCGVHLSEVCDREAYP